MKRINLLTIVALLSLTNAIAQLPYPKFLKDMNTNMAVYPSFIGEVNGKMLFTLSDAIHGTNIWVTDGTQSGTSILDVDIQDVNTGITEVIGDKRYFVSENVKLWETDGTAQGTHLVYTYAPQPVFPSAIIALKNIGGKLFLVAGYTNENEVLRLDAPGQAHVVFAQNGSNAPFSLTDFNGKLVFAILSPYSNPIANLYMLNDLSQNYATPLTSNQMQGLPSGFTVVGDEMYFRWIYENNYGQELWKTDGSPAGTVRVKDINPGIGSSLPAGFIHNNGTLFFIADDGIHGRELWKTDGTDAGTVLVKDIQPGQQTGIPYISGDGGFIAMNGKIYFTADDGTNGLELWCSDGTEAGTMMVKDINNGPLGSNTNLYFATADNRILMRAINELGQELWVSDGTVAGTQLVKDLYPGSATGVESYIYKLGDKALFTAKTNENNTTLYISDGTAAGTHTVFNFTNQNSDIAQPVRINGNFLFLARQNSSMPYDIWKSAGTHQSTKIAIKSTDWGIGIIDVPEFTYFDGAIYFFATNDANAEYLWKMDEALTTPMPIHPDAYLYSPLSYPPHKLTVMGGHLYYLTSNTHQGIQLWRSDGSPAGAQLIKDFIPPAGNAIYPLNLKILDDKIFLTIYNTATGQELWQSDGTISGTVRVANLTKSGLNYNNFHTDLHQMDSLIYFSAYDSIDFSKTLWRSNGTASGTFLLKKFDMNISTGNEVLSEMAKLDDKLFFAAADQNQGIEIWYTQGTSASTYMLRDINPGANASKPKDFTAAANKLFFTAETAANGRELWVTDGVVHHTKLLQDIKPGPAAADVYQLTPCNGLLTFTADDGQHGREIWLTDGTAAGTYPVTNFSVQSISSVPSILGCANDILYFSAPDVLHGQELWRLVFPEGPQVPGLAELELVQPQVVSKMQVYPNPSQGSISVEMDMEQPGEADFELLDEQGHLLRPLGRYHLQECPQTLRFSLDALPSGIYYLRSQQQGRQWTAKFLRI